MKNFLKLFESELDKAEVILAAKNISDRLQKLTSDISKMKVDDIPSLVERIKQSYGVSQGNEFNETITKALDDLVDNALQVKSTVDDHSLVLSGDADKSDITNDMEFDNDMEVPEDNDEDEKPEPRKREKVDIEGEDVLGRRLKKKIRNESVNRLLESIKDSKKRQIVLETYHSGKSGKAKVISFAEKIARK